MTFASVAPIGAFSFGAEKDRDDRVARGHFIGLDGHAGGQAVGDQRDRSAKILAPGLNQDRLAISPGDRRRHHVGPAPERFVGRAQLEPGTHGADFDAIGIIRPTLLQMVGHGDHEIAVLRRGESEIAVRTFAVVVARHASGVLAENVQNRVQWRANPARNHANVVSFPFPRFESYESTSPVCSIAPLRATGGVNGVAVSWVSFGSDSIVLPNGLRRNALG